MRLQILPTRRGGYCVCGPDGMAVSDQDYTDYQEAIGAMARLQDAFDEDNQTDSEEYV
jgi:hypothetical protein